MHLNVLIGLLLALACAAGTNLGGLWKQKGALQASDVDIRQPLKTAAALFRSKWFTVGWLVALVGWLLHVGALALAPLSLAQAVISGGLVTLGVLAERFFGFKLERRQWIGLGFVALGMAVLAATAHSDKNRMSYAIVAIAAFEAVALALAAAFVLSCRVQRLRNRHGMMLGAAAGLMFGVSDVSIKAVTTSAHGFALLSLWSAIALAAGIAAFYASARSFQIGEGVAVIAAAAAAANMLGIVGGVVVFGEPLGHDVVTVAARVGAFLLVGVSVSLLPAPVRAHEAAREETIDPPEDREQTSDGPSGTESHQPHRELRATASA